MASNVLSWGAAISRGYEPKLYPYHGNAVPIGEVEATLDFKIWAKKVMAINCYFTVIGDVKKFQLTIYCSRPAGHYKIKGSDLNFANCATGTAYKLFMALNEGGKPILSGIIAL